MKFEHPLIPGKLIQRYKRFLADVKLDSGKKITAHCPNSGSMKSCKTPGWPVLLSHHDNHKRKFNYTWEMIHNGQCWIGINTGVPNIIAKEAIEAGHIPELAGYDQIRREVPYGKNSRIDLLLSNQKQSCFVEVKNVTLVEEDSYYYFPDAVTERGRKHLLELKQMVEQDHRSVMLFVIQRSDGRIFKPATHIDPMYAETLREVNQRGVEILVYQSIVSPDAILLGKPVKWQLD